MRRAAEATMATGASSAWQPPVLIPPAVPIVVDEDPKPVEAPKKPEPPKEPEDPKQVPASKNTATPCPVQDDVSSGASSGKCVFSEMFVVRGFPLAVR